MARDEPLPDMPLTRIEMEGREKQILAPYAQFSAETRGRKYQEEPADWRTHYQRDRDRIIHSRAFRRLEYKTQVFLNGTGDHLRTRLTHTMEVVAIGRNIARALSLNEDLAETIALAHDLGHPPFGHKGEGALNKLMQNHGGFEHNQHSLRIVEELEQKYPRFPGLNLSWEVREGLAKHNTGYDQPFGGESFKAPCPSLEAQVANLADEIAYYSHDLDDGLASGLLTENQLNQEVRLWREAAHRVELDYGLLADECRRYFIIRCLIDGQIRDVVGTTEQQILRSGIRTAMDARLQAEPLVRYSPERHNLNLELRQYLYTHLYHNPVVHEPNLRAVRMLEDLFKFFLAHPAQLAEPQARRVEKIGLQRVICDYLAGMTDRYAFAEFERLIHGQPPANEMPG